jgi:hypothetical protein
MSEVCRISAFRAATVLAVGVTLCCAAFTGAPRPAAVTPPHYAHVIHGRGHRHDDNIWAGYADTGATYTSVSGSWTVPTLDCADTPDSSTSPWVGIDGWNDSTVEQIGIDTDCTSGVAGYYPWVEMYPADSIYFDDPVNAGDQMTASVSVSGTSFTLTESDSTQGWTKTYQEQGSDQLASAEAILEDLGDNMPPVANFGTLRFTDLTANGQPFGSAGTPNSTDLERGDTMLTQTSAIDSSGSQFSIDWLQQ